MVSANTKAAHETSIAGNVDPKPDEEENEEDGEASELENNFPPLCLLVPQQGEPEEKASEETEHMSNDAHSAVLLSEPPVEGAAEVEGGEEKDEDELEQPNQFSAKCMRRLCVVQPVDQDHLVLVPVVDRGAEAGGHEAVDSPTGTKQGAVVESVVGKGAADDPCEEQDEDSQGSVPHLQQAACEDLKEHVGDDVRGVQVDKGVGHISPDLTPAVPKKNMYCQNV